MRILYTVLQFNMLDDVSHSQINRFSGSVEILVPARFAGVAQVAGIDPVSGTPRRKAGSQESSQSQLKGLLSRRLQIEIRDALKKVSNYQYMTS